MVIGRLVLSLLLAAGGEVDVAVLSMLGSLLTIFTVAD
jgi:hypothetical protein